MQSQAVGHIEWYLEHDFGGSSSDEEDRFGPPRETFSRTLVEVFTVEVLNTTAEDLEIYGTVEINSGNRRICIYNRYEDESVLIKGNKSVHLLLNGPDRVFGLDSGKLSFAASLYDKQDAHVIHTSFGNHSSNFDEGVRTIQLRREKAYHDELEVDKRLLSLRLVLSYVVYDCAVAAHINVSLLGENSGFSPVYGYIAAASDAYPKDSSCLFMKIKNEALSPSPGDEVKLSKSVVAVPSNGKLSIKIAIPGIANDVLEFRAKEDGEKDSMDAGRINVRISWKVAG